MVQFRINGNIVECAPISYSDVKAGEFYLAFIAFELKDHVFYGMALEESTAKTHWNGRLFARGSSLGQSSKNSRSRLNFHMYALNGEVENKGRDPFVFKPVGGETTRKFFKIVKVNGASI